MVATSADSDEELAAPLGLLLTSSAVGVAERMIPNTSWSRFTLNLARRPRSMASRAAALGRELVTIAEGRSDIAPGKGDKRFADPAWVSSPVRLEILSLLRIRLRTSRRRPTVISFATASALTSYETSWGSRPQRRRVT